MIEREKTVDPQEVIRLKQQLPVAEKTLKLVRDKLSKSSSGYYSVRVMLPEGRTDWRIDWDVVRMIGGGILRMSEVLRKGDLNQVDSEQHSLAKISPQESDK